MIKSIQTELEFVENLYKIYMAFFPILFLVLKFLIVFILLSLGILYLLSLKGIFLKQKLFNIKYEDDDFNNLRIVLGVIFIFLAFGFLFNYLIYFFIWLFQYFDGFLLVLIRVIESFIIENYNMNFAKFNNIINQIIALGSFVAILQIVLASFYFISNRIVLINTKKATILIVSSAIEILLFGFECLPYLL